MNSNINLSNLILKCNIISYKKLKDIIINLNMNNISPLSKGYVGNVVENFFNSANKNKSQCDFIDLGIELKTISLNIKNEPLNNIFICSYSSNINSLTWEKSILYNKIKHILFVPYYKYDDKNIYEYKFLKPFFFKMNKTQEFIIKNDWNNLMRLFFMGEFHKLKSCGTYIHILSHSKSNFDKMNIFDSNGDKKTLIRKAFYFKKIFIKKLIFKFSKFY